MKSPKLQEISGPLRDGGMYHIRLIGSKVDATAIRHVMRVLDMTAEWLEDDEKLAAENLQNALDTPAS